MLNYKLPALLLLLLFCASFVYAQDSVKVVSKITEEDIVLNYLAGVKTDNLGLKVSAAFYLGERQSQKAVIPLMNVLKSDPNPEARIMAALSLYKIGDERGLFAVQRAVDYDQNEQVRKICKIFYQMYQTEQELKK